MDEVLSSVPRGMEMELRHHQLPRPLHHVDAALRLVAEIQKQQQPPGTDTTITATTTSSSSILLPPLLRLHLATRPVVQPSGLTMDDFTLGKPGRLPLVLNFVLLRIFLFRLPPAGLMMDESTLNWRLINWVPFISLFLTPHIIHSFFPL